MFRKLPPLCMRLDSGLRWNDSGYAKASYRTVTHHVRALASRLMSYQSLRAASFVP